MTERAERIMPAKLARWAPALLVAGLWLFHTISNWIWLNKNVMTRGWDRIGALVNSLIYHDTLSTFSLQALFKATVQDEIRPPLFGASMAIMYKLFGVSADVAVMVNAVYWAILLAACYGIGSRLGGRRLGMLSAVLVALLPLVYSMSRYSYFEFSVAALAALSIYLLLASERFENRGFSILFGISLGLGALIKRTFPVFVIGAGLVVFFQAGLPRKLAHRLRSILLPRWRDVGLAVGGGLLLSAIWYWPNQALAQTLPAGIWMFPIWWAIFAVTIYLLLQPPSTVSNFLSCGALGVSVASLWYLPRSNFVQRALRAGWGVDDPRGRTVDLGALSTYTEYIDSIVSGFSPFFVVLLILTVGLLLTYQAVKKRRLLPDRWWNSGWLVLVASLVLAYFILSTSIYKEPRAITPLLPTFGIILAGTLLALPWRWLRTVLIALAIVFGVVQFFAVSFTETRWLVTQTNFGQPLLGQSGVFAQGTYMEVPDSGLNDPGYYIAGDVLERVEAARQREGWDTISLGVLAGSSHVHVGMFAYDQLRGYPGVRPENPVQVYPQDSPYSMAYRYDYVLVLSQGNRNPALREAADLILGERRRVFEQAFALDTVYSLPDGNKAYLYRRKTKSAGEYNDPALYELAQTLHETVEESDLIIVHPATMLNSFLEHYWGKASIISSDEVELALEPSYRVFLITSQGTEVDAWIEKVLVNFSKTDNVQFGELRLLVFEASGF